MGTTDEALLLGYLLSIILAMPSAIGVAYPDDPGPYMLRSIWWPLVVVRWLVMGLRLALQGLWLELGEMEEVAERDGRVVVCRNIGRLPMLPYDFDDAT